MDLIIRSAQLAEHADGQLVDIGVSGGRIAAIEPTLSADAEIFDAGGRLTCGGLIETHIHLDKSRLLDICPTEPGRQISPVHYVAPFKPDITEADVRRRAELTLRECLIPRLSDQNLSKLKPTGTTAAIRRSTGFGQRALV